MGKVNFRATHVPEKGGEATGTNERRFRASVEEAMAAFDREIERLQRELFEARTARWEEVTYSDQVLVTGWTELTVDTVNHNNLKGQGVYRLDLSMLATGSNANAEVQLRGLINGTVLQTSAIIGIGVVTDEKLTFVLFVTGDPTTDAIDIEARGLNATITNINASFVRIGYEETM